MKDKHEIDKKESGAARAQSRSRLAPAARLGLLFFSFRLWCSFDPSPLVGVFSPVIRLGDTRWRHRRRRRVSLAASLPGGRSRICTPSETPAAILDSRRRGAPGAERARAPRGGGGRTRAMRQNNTHELIDHLFIPIDMFTDRLGALGAHGGLSAARGATQDPPTPPSPFCSPALSLGPWTGLARPCVVDAPRLNLLQETRRNSNVEIWHHPLSSLPHFKFHPECPSLFRSLRRNLGLFL